jgi:hypothetical protein
MTTGYGRRRCSSRSSRTHLPRGARRLPDACVEVMCGANLILHAGDFADRSVTFELVTLQ